MTHRWWTDPRHEPRGGPIVSSHNHLPTGAVMTDAQAFRERAVRTMSDLADELDRANARIVEQSAHIRLLNESRRALMDRDDGERWWP